MAQWQLGGPKPIQRCEHIFEAARPAGRHKRLGKFALVAGILVPLSMIATRQRDAWSWAIISACITFLGFLVRFFRWLGAATIGCGGRRAASASPDRSRED